MALLVLAACNMAAFHRIGTREIVHWDAAGGTPVAAKTAGGISLLVWIAVVVCGRGSASHCTSPAAGVFFCERPASQSREGRPYAIPIASDVCCARLDRGGRRPERTEEAADHHQSAADGAGLCRSRQVAGLERRVEPEDH